MEDTRIGARTLLDDISDFQIDDISEVQGDDMIDDIIDAIIENISVTHDLRLDSILSTTISSPYHLHILIHRSITTSAMQSHHHLDMTGEETRRVQPDEGNLLRGVPMLEGAVNIALWMARLKPALDRLDRAYWPILHASEVPSHGVIKVLPSRAHVIQILSKSSGRNPSHSEPVPKESVDTYLEEYYLRPNAMVQNWLAMDKKLHTLLLSTLQGHIKDRVAHTEHAFDAYNIIKNSYRALMPNIMVKWTKWTRFVYDPESHSAQEFTEEWNDHLDNLLTTCGHDTVSASAQVFQFIAAVTFAQECMHPWARHLRVDMSAPDALERVQADFLMDQERRMDPDYCRGF